MTGQSGVKKILQSSKVKQLLHQDVPDILNESISIYLVFWLTFMYKKVFWLLEVSGEIRGKPGVIFVGHRQTMQTQIRRHRTRRLTRVSIVSLHNVLLEFD